MNRIFFIFTFIFTAFLANAQVRFSVSAPSSAVMDETFQVKYELNAIGENFRAPDFKDFDLLAGPYAASSSSFQVIGGKRTSADYMSYTITLMPKKLGTFSVGTASIVVDGRKYVSKGFSIQIITADAKPKQQQNGSQNTSKSISSENIFIKPQLSKTQVFEQEAILLTYKLYTTLDVINCYPLKLPNFQEFMKQDVELPRNREYAWEKMNGKNYVTAQIVQVLLFPQQSGTITIPPAEFEANIQVQQANVPQSIFDDNFGDASILKVPKKITVPAVSINVSKLPEAGKPASFSGAVGQFSLSSSLSSDKIKANEAATLKIVISGAGNMKMVKNPDIKFPSDVFELYDPKVANDFKVSAAGISGTKTIEYLFIPRSEGKYEIPAADFSYFDTRSNVYKTITTPVYKIQVSKGSEAGNAVITSGTQVNKEDIKQLGNDIRYINADKNIQLKKNETLLFGSLLAWLLYIVPLTIASVLFFIFRKKAQENADIKFTRNKRANKIATKRLHHAQRLLAEGKKDLFYEEVLKAVWNYLGDKLTISAAELTKENISNKLQEKGVQDVQIQTLNSILNTCEFARYAPNTGQTEMGNLYAETIEMISKLELEIRN
ncbi:MAG: BatD family protein [Prevotellaceae bacterium]|jgi:hypothetical protein|nr:BatD family protein [Prevotellaceae bacterium]